MNKLLSPIYLYFINCNNMVTSGYAFALAVYAMHRNSFPSLVSFLSSRTSLSSDFYAGQGNHGRRVREILMLCAVGPRHKSNIVRLCSLTASSTGHRRKIYFILRGLYASGLLKYENGFYSLTHAGEDAIQVMKKDFWSWYRKEKGPEGPDSDL